MADHIVIGGGHNGLVTACYLARAGLDVVVLEQSAKLGGGSRTDELVPGYRFNTHSAAHNIINATGIVEELELQATGLEYREMDPFSIAVHGDGAIVRFHRSVVTLCRCWCTWRRQPCLPIPMPRRATGTGCSPTWTLLVR